MLNADGTLPTWTLIQRRGQYGNPEDLFSSKLWNDYEQGFGEPDKGRMLVLFSINHFATEFWLGLKTLADLTSMGSWELLVKLEDFQGTSYVAIYHNFRVGPGPLYKLSVSGFDDSTSNLTDSLTPHSGASFSTKDRDNDALEGINCALLYLGAWWYGTVTPGICHYTNLNGYNYNRGDLPHDDAHFAKGIIWKNEKKVSEQDHYFSWPKVEMKMRKIF